MRVHIALRLGSRLLLSLLQQELCELMPLILLSSFTGLLRLPLSDYFLCNLSPQLEIVLTSAFGLVTLLLELSIDSFLHILKGFSSLCLGSLSILAVLFRLFAHVVLNLLVP